MFVIGDDEMNNEQDDIGGMRKKNGDDGIKMRNEVRTDDRLILLLICVNILDI